VRASWAPEPDCAIAAAVGVVGEGWSLLIIRDIARGVDRFDALAAGLHISRKVLTERLAALLDAGVLRREPYQDGPTRYAYQLTECGRALLPVLVGLQDWGDRWLLGDGELTGSARRDGSEAHRVRGLVGTVLPPLRLPSTAGRDIDVVDGTTKRTVLFGYPATGVPGPLPPGWSGIPGAAGCTLENRLFAAAYPRFTAAGVAVQGFSTQRVEEQVAFAAIERIPFPLLSDAGLDLIAALRLPTFRGAGTERVKRVVLVVGADRRIRGVRYPVTDLDDAVDWALRTSTRGTTRSR
jgi:DNA-binding HxlR family transcriptional regulator/peroxiredoxin